MMRQMAWLLGAVLAMSVGIAAAQTPKDTVVMAKRIDDIISLDPGEEFEFSGGEVRRGSIVGTADADGELSFAYCMVLDNGETVTGRCHSVPEIMEDGRIRLAETWERQGPEPSHGVSVLEELRPA